MRGEASSLFFSLPFLAPIKEMKWNFEVGLFFGGKGRGPPLFTVGARSVG